MGWLDRLHEAGVKATEAKREVTPPPPRLEVQSVTVQVRPSGRDGDPGEVTHGYFTFADGQLTMTDEKGVALAGSIAVQAGGDPRAVARAETSRRWKENGRFNRRLEYGRSGLDF